MSITRRGFLGSIPAAGLALAGQSHYRVGITTNTRGGWEKDVFLSFREAHEAGYRYVESFINYFKDFLDKPADLRKQVDGIGVKFVTISNGSPLEMAFEDPSKRNKLLEDHMRLVRFIKQLGCDHLKVNTNTRRANGTTAANLKEMAVTLNELGKRITAEGLKFGVHPHMWTQLENRREIDAIAESTDARYVNFVLDTGHITMAGIDPVELARAYGSRIIEFHLKDVNPEHRGGAKQRRDRNDVMKDPIFFELGKGGVDFPAIKAHLDKIGWQGWLTVELDSSPYRPPKESARISRQYIEKTLGIKVS
ncbi:MAG TPA: sugar phosphate isomerase/epimerase [Bryobacteraceae bacterium]|nr:sugar phosphate isomerase/epimerase [Bryobacteraceae bacterium]